MLNETTGNVNIQGVVGLKNHIAYHREGVTVQSIYLRKAKREDENGKKYTDKFVDMRPVIFNENYLLRNNFIEVEDSIVFSTISNKKKTAVKVAKKDDKYPGSRSILVISAGGDLSRVNSVLSGVYVNWSLGIFATKVKYDYRSLMSDKLGNPQYYKDYVFFDKDGKLKNDCDYYIFFNSTTSMKRKKQYIGVRCNNNEDKAKIEEALNNMTHGAYSMYKGKANDRAGNIKLSDRMGLALTSNKDLGAVSCYAIYDGEWEYKYLAKDDREGKSESNRKYKNLKPFKGTGKRKDIIKSVKFFDGSAIVSASFASKVYGAELQENICEKNAISMWPQFRMLGTAKAFGAVLPDSVVEEIITRMSNDGVRIARFDKVTDSVLKQIADGEFKNCLIIIGKGLPEVLMDRNNLKTYSDFTREAHFHVLDIAKPALTRTNIQTVQSLSLTEGFEETLFELGKDTIDRHLEALLAQTDRPIDIEAAISGYTPNIIPTVSNDYARREPAIWQQIVTSAIKGVEGAISGINFDLDGIFARGTGDFGCFFGIRVVGDGEIFVKGIKPGAKCQVTRTPKAGVSEHYMAKIIDMNHVLSVVGKSGLSRNERIAIISAFNSVPEGVVVTPASDEFKNTTGGSDLDFDAFSIVYDERWVSLAEQVKQDAINIGFGKGVDDGTRHEFSRNSMRRGWYDFVLSENENIGTVCNRNSIILALMTAPRNIAIQILAEGLCLAIPSQDFTLDEYETMFANTDKYERMFAKPNVTIGNKETLAMFCKARESNLFDDKSRLNILLDINAIFCSIEGRIIDAAKTGEKVPTFMKQISEIGVFANVLQNTMLSISNDNKVFNDLFLISALNKEGITTIPCIVSATRTKIADYAAQRLSEIINPLEFAEEHKVQFEQGGTGKSIASLACIKEMYKDAVNIFRGKEDDSIDFEEDCIKSASVSRKKVLDYLGNFVRIMTSDQSVTDRWSVAKFVSMRGKGDALREDGGNAFYTVLEQETILSVSKLFGVNDTVGAEIKLTAPYKEGQVMQFHDGRTDGAIAVKGKITGEFVIKKIGSKFYATTELKSVVKVPETDNRFVVRLHAVENKRLNEVIKAILASESVVIKANPVDGDCLIGVDANGVRTKIARISVNDNNRLSKFYNNIVAKVDHVVVGDFLKNKTKLKAALLLLTYTGYEAAGIEYKTINPALVEAKTIAKAKAIAIKQYFESATGDTAI